MESMNRDIIEEEGIRIQKTAGEIKNELFSYKNSIDQAQIPDEERKIFDSTYDYYYKQVDKELNIDKEVDNYFKVELNDDQEKKIRNTILNPVKAEHYAVQRNLPLYRYKPQIIRALRKKQVVLITAETGSGKSTQVPQYLYYHPLSKHKHVLCTQPRRIAAMSMAQRVNFEMKDYVACPIVRSITSLCDEAKILYFSEAALLKYLMTEIHKPKPLLNSSVLLVDEAHERSIENDVILGLFKEYILPRRKDFRLIIMSASIDFKKLYELFPRLEHVDCPDRVYPVTTKYLKSYSDYFYETVDIAANVAIGKVKNRKWNQTILVFLVGYDELCKAYKMLESRLEEYLGFVSIFLLYGRMELKKQYELLNKTYENTVRIILSTNIAESSLTVHNVTVVVDCCREKKSRYVQNKNLKELRVSKISKASAKQREGRAGRMCKGKCYRMLTEDEFQNLEDYRIPGILHSHLGTVLLRFLKYGISNFWEFPLMDRPKQDAVRESYRELYLMSAIVLQEEEGMEITNLGEFIIQIDLEPQSSKALYHAITIFGCGLDTLLIICYLKSASFIFDKNESMFPIFIDEQDENAQFLQNDYLLRPELLSMGEFIQALFIIRQYLLIRCDWCFPNCNIDQRLLWNWKCKRCIWIKRAWVNSNRLNFKGIKNTLELYMELYCEISRHGHVLKSCISEDIMTSELELACHIALACSQHSNENPINLEEVFSNIIKEYEAKSKALENSFILGFYNNLAYSRGVRKMDYGYIQVETKEVVCPHPSSHYARLFNANPPEYVIFYEVVASHRHFMKYVFPIKLDSVKELAKDWLTHLNFEEISEDFETLEFGPLGPAITSRLLGLNGNKIAQIERVLNETDAKGTVLSVDQNQLVALVNSVHKNMAESKINSFLTSVRDDVLKLYSFQYTYAVGVVLHVAPGGLILSIQENKNALAFEINNIQKYDLIIEIRKDFRNRFDFHMLSFKIFHDKLSAIIYFTDENQVEEAKKALLEIPLPGIDGPISEMKQLKTTLSKRVTYGISLPWETTDGEVDNILVFGGISIERIQRIRSRHSLDVNIQFPDNQTARHSLSQLNIIAEDEFGASWETKDSPGEEYLIPWQILSIKENRQIYQEIYKRGAQAGVSISFRGNNKLVLKDCSDLTVPVINIIHVIQPALFPVSPVSFKYLRTIEIDCGLRWAEWQEYMQVHCEYIFKRAVMVIYGHPENRENAQKIIQSNLVALENNLVTESITMNTLSEYSKRFDQIKHLAMRNMFSYQFNRKELTITITGTIDILNDVKQAMSIEEAKSEKQKCPVCFNPVSPVDKLILMICGHEIHKECLHMQILTQIRDVPFPDLPLKCTECQEPLVHEDWNKVLPIEEQQSLYYAALKLHLSNNPAFEFCENPECNGFYNKENHLKAVGNIRECNFCKLVYCVQCHEQVFSNSHSANCQRQAINEEFKENAHWLDHNTQKCPECYFPVQKNKGCNHIQCPRCRCDYCFLCGVRLKASDVHGHFLEPDSTCYQKLFDPGYQ